jgi:hypothetical protein
MIRKTNWLKNNWLIVLTIIWFIVGFVLVFIFLSIYKMVNWEVLTGFATWILVGGVAVASWQINQARKSTNAQLTVGYYWKFREDKAVEKLRSIYALGSKAFKDLQANKKKEIDYVLDWLDKLGALVVRNILDKQLAIEVFAGLPALRCWYKLSEYIKEERKNRGLRWSPKIRQVVKVGFCS